MQSRKRGMVRTKAPAKKPAPRSKSVVKRPVAKAVKPSWIENPIIEASDVRTILFELGRVLAPADLSRLMNHEPSLRERAESLQDPKLALLKDQTVLALSLIADHLADRTPQIPYFTVAVLGAAVSYFSEALDIIPDFLPRIGRLDDAMVMAVAFEIVEDGIRRYCDAKGLHSARYFTVS